jgi:competence protein ComEC
LLKNWVDFIGLINIDVEYMGKLKKSIIAILLIIATVISVGCQQASISTPIVNTTTTTSPTLPTTSVPSTSSKPTTIIPSTTLSTQSLKVTFLDVGQADCTIIQYGTSAMIIDAGGNSTATLLIAAIKKMGINKFDVAIGTHPHEDHIGGLDTVINNFNIGAIYMPKVSNNTKTFEDVLLAIQNKGLTVTTPVPGTSFTLGDSVRCTIPAPNSQSYPDLNSYSIVIKMTYNNVSFLFTGDAETDSEIEMLAKGHNLKADVLKVGHHGSTSSTSPQFLTAVSPKYAVIFVGKDNTYGHPHQETLNKLNAAEVKIYRTDLNGAIMFTVTGSNITVTTEK